MSLYQKPMSRETCTALLALKRKYPWILNSGQNGRNLSFVPCLPFQICEGFVLIGIFRAYRPTIFGCQRIAKSSCFPIPSNLCYPAFFSNFSKTRVFFRDCPLPLGNCSETKEFEILDWRHLKSRVKKGRSDRLPSPSRRGYASKNHFR